ncbi:uncharacterized protein TNIN_339371 [Trichonephila inaurata madagascariensis]|uniref:C2H2-type domain-containing protein n=1 Tax=Trichonephila inaurata madagascariensis TaxID=2747483 RepID=A0A8X7CNG9_9ARAC|nr:uncharacterized protein TNIN_155771 [Trichonephila inaurata madagascariensis]GFY72155.1 uncharacterized protein TNIN_339371 [Trichonephila inaurata madagascariensis]
MRIFSISSDKFFFNVFAGFCYTRFENTKQNVQNVPIEILPFLKQRPELSIFSSKPTPPPTTTRTVQYHCEFCPFETGSVQQFEAHLNSHKSTTAHQCSICGKVFKNTSKLQAHMLTHDSSRQHTCIYCEKKFKTPATLKAHMKSHFQFVPLKCNYCEKGFPNETLLRRHVVQHQIHQ